MTASGHGDPTRRARTSFSGVPRSARRRRGPRGSTRAAAGLRHGLVPAGERKSIEPMAARIEPRRVRARHQSMHHFVANAPWDGGAVLRVAPGLGAGGDGAARAGGRVGGG